MTTIEGKKKTARVNMSSASAAIRAVLFTRTQPSASSHPFTHTECHRIQTHARKSLEIVFLSAHTHTHTYGVSIHRTRKNRKKEKKKKPVSAMIFVPRHFLRWHCCSWCCCCLIFANKYTYAHAHEQTQIALRFITEKIRDDSIKLRRS